MKHVKYKKSVFLFCSDAENSNKTTFSHLAQKLRTQVNVSVLIGG